VYDTLHTTIIANITPLLISFFLDELRDQHIQFHPLTKLYTYCYQHLQLKTPLVVYDTLYTTIIASITPSLTSFIFG
jgi:hypothetical protein